MKTIVTLFVSLIILSACNTKMEKENLALKAKNDSLIVVNANLRKGSAELATNIDSYKELLQEIDNNLATIDETSAMVRKLGSEAEGKDADTEKSIKEHITNIGALLENSRLKLISMDKNLNKLRKESGNQSEEILQLEERVNTLAANLLDKEQEIIMMEDDLYDEIMDLEIKLSEEAAKSAQLSAMLNRAYYIKGTAKQLKDMGIVQKEGGFIGLGRVKVLNAKASSALFTQIEKDKTIRIDLPAKKAQLITMHPDGSYSFEGDNSVESLAINDMESFWKNSNFLVIEVTE